MEQEQLFPLLCQTAEGERAAFAELYKITSPQLYAVALKMLKREDLAEEVMQEAFVKIWHNAGNYQRSKGTVLTWMVSIVRYRSLDLIRYHGIRHEVPLSNEHGPPPEHESNPHFSSEIEKLEKCMEELDVSQRQAIQLAYVNGLTHQEVVEHLHSPLGTIKSWIRRGLQSLQRCLSL
tara:strand:+ start:58 stop:591 length:534 start_codon:yes stop_codon:yes gene_type:complete